MKIAVRVMSISDEEFWVM